MPEIIDFPVRLMRGAKMSAYPVPISRSGGVSMSGREQIISADNSIWRVNLTLPRRFERDDVRTWEALITRLRGRLNIARFPICDPYRYGEARSPRQEPYSDGQWYTDGTGHLVEGGGTQPMQVSQTAAVGATEAYVTLTEPTRPRLRPGDLFSNQGHLYRVVGSTDGGWVRFEPKLRNAMAVGGTLETDPPIFQGRLASDDSGMFGREFHRWLEGGSLTFVEAF